VDNRHEVLVALSHLFLSEERPRPNCHRPRPVTGKVVEILDPARPETSLLHRHDPASMCASAHHPRLPSLPDCLWHSTRPDRPPARLSEAQVLDRDLRTHQRFVQVLAEEAAPHNAIDNEARDGAVVEATRMRWPLEAACEQTGSPLAGRQFSQPGCELDCIFLATLSALLGRKSATTPYRPDRSG